MVILTMGPGEPFSPGDPLSPWGKMHRVSERVPTGSPQKTPRKKPKALVSSAAPRPPDFSSARDPALSSPGLLLFQQDVGPAVPNQSSSEC